jgi:OmpA-OmpF porin, OOP family
MAVSQYLRPEGLLEAVRNHITPDVIHNASSFSGEPESATRQALHTSIASALGGITRISSSPEGATSLFNVIREDKYDSTLNNTAGIFSGGNASSKTLDMGRQLTNRVFGNKTSAISDVIARSSGVSTNSATKLFSLITPLTLGVLGRHAAAQGLNASGLSNLLADQKDEIMTAAPAGLSRVLEQPTGPSLVPSASESTVSRATETVREGAPSPLYQQERTTRRSSGSRGWLVLLLLICAAAILTLLLRGRSAQHAANLARQQAANATGAIGNVAHQAEGAIASMTLPGGVHVSLPQGSMNYNLANYLASNDAAPRTFVFDHLNFQPGSIALTDESVPTVNNLASILNAYPNSNVQIAGYTDNSGDPQSNRALSLSRASAVKAMLVHQGVNAPRITSIGMGADHPIASNNTDVGRAQNQRLELTVTQK